MAAAGWRMGIPDHYRGKSAIASVIRLTAAPDNTALAAVFGWLRANAHSQAPILPESSENSVSFMSETLTIHDD